jgi:predicted metal-dependent hydrolase
LHPGIFEQPEKIQFFSNLMNYIYQYQLIRSRKRRKTISLHIKRDGRIVVYAPYHTPNLEIEKFVETKHPWISGKLLEREKTIKPAEKGFFPGEEFLYLGESYPLEIEDNLQQKHPLALSFGRFILNKSCIEKARHLFIEWYKEEARRKLPERVDYYSHRLQLFPIGVKITSAHSRWGSCSRDNRLCFSWRLVMAPLGVLDYVLIHELVHIKEKNHSDRFWNYLGSIIPDYKIHRRWLREHEQRMRL